ncbi:MAG: excisionase, partial [Gammaproteobacteria bacterium]|nr:excisionase [Gammaproteobacteria bacterium]
MTQMSVNWLTIRKFSEQTGYSEHAVRTKIRDGVWL